MTDPIQRALFLSDFISQDKNGGKWFAIGIYEEILCSGFPSAPLTVNGFASVGDISGRCGVDIIITGPDDSEVVRKKGGDVEIGPNHMLNIGFIIKGVVFKEPGKHQVKIYINGKLGAQISVSVSQAAVHVR